LLRERGEKVSGEREWDEECPEGTGGKEKRDILERVTILEEGVCFACVM
jgi:hypothetical protein